MQQIVFPPLSLCLPAFVLTISLTFLLSFLVSSHLGIQNCSKHLAKTIIVGQVIFGASSWKAGACVCGWVCSAEEALHSESIVMARKWWMISSSAFTVMKTHYWLELPVECENGPIFLFRNSSITRPKAQKFFLSCTRRRVRHNRRVRSWSSSACK